MKCLSRIRSIGFLTCAFLYCTSPVSAIEVGAQYDFQSLGKSNRGFFWRAASISDVGQGEELVIVGSDIQNGVLSTPVRWTQSAGPELLFYPPQQALATDVSADGKVVVGTELVPATGYRAYRWTPEGGVQYLGLVPGGGNRSDGFGVTRDGSVVVGNSRTSTIGLGFQWDATNLIQPLGTVLSGGNFLGNNWAASDTVRASDGTLWSVGQSNMDGGSGAGVIWKNLDVFSVSADLFSGSTIIPAVAAHQDSIIMPVNRSTGGSAGAFGFGILRLNIASENVVDAAPQVPQNLRYGFQAYDISSDSSIVVGSAILSGIPNGTVSGIPNARSEPHIWEEEGRIWGSSASSTPGLEGQYWSQNLYELLQEKLPPSLQSHLLFDDWALNVASGVTVGEVFSPSLGRTVVTSTVIGNGLDPNGSVMPWMATVRHAPGLELESLSMRTLFDDGDFAGDGSAWDELGEGTFELVVSPSGNGLAARLTTDTEFSISQLIDTPDTPFVLVLDQLFTTDVGSFQVTLDGVLLDELVAPTTIGSELTTTPILVADPALLGRTGITLSLVAFGGSTGQIIIDNVAIASVPEPSSFVLFIAASACLGMRRRVNRGQVSY